MATLATIKCAYVYISRADAQIEQDGRPLISQMYSNLVRYLELLCSQSDMYWDRCELSEIEARCEFAFDQAFACVKLDDKSVKLDRFHGTVYWRNSDASIMCTCLDEAIIKRKRTKGKVSSLLSIARVAAAKALVDIPGSIESMPNTLRHPVRPPKEIKYWSIQSLFIRYKMRF